MAVTSKLYGNFLMQAFREEHNLETDDIRTMLAVVGYVPDQDVDNYHDDVVANEVAAAGGYAALGYAHGVQTLTYTAGTDIISYDLDDATWAASTITARVAVQYNHTGGGASNSWGLIAYHLSNVDVVSTAGTFSVVFDASGLFVIDVS